MFILSILASISIFFIRYSKGFTTAEILERRIDAIETTFFTLLIMTGFKPIFKLLSNIIIFIKNAFLGIFFPQKKLRNLEMAAAKQEHREQLLLEKLDKVRITNEKLLSHIEQQKHKVAIWQSKKERKQKLKNQRNTFGKENEDE
ncbi:hypothetical protein J8J04_02740 ['Fragaria x ananassa' phyllody phytoplasma]|uniref:Uncharacterized protein n=1 Tax='Fragaria x ananassa' phyllody phytoplasma TaxID=2358428 RepID=A0ABS5K593_9MOLU|nr:hypothetical protein ['Fragaria x ananassa' phyllody phytoplasma]MBS2126590.1 hypothetical protein ['Fragaria x ananassa' phyllody phytoplasma]